MRIGIDLDNTIIHYDNAFLVAARERNLLPADFTGTKQQLRDHIRTLPDGETQWQKLQGYVYGQGIAHAALYPGVKPFITQALGAGHTLFIASHKTEFGHYDESKTNLRDAAIAFLEAEGMFTLPGFGREHISFHPTRAGKVEKIATLSLDWFIDDLVEVYKEPHFPAHVKKILFHTSTTTPPAGDWQLCRDWQAITQTIFT
ncbi:MAG: hypothetical protein SFX19_06440 [Alphaproteobacteria bacterium]|nr:hypothetical protein [Alphaproteobacteria bacterium]